MSYNPDDYTNERRTAVALERIADTLDDFMDMTLAAQAITQALSDRNPDVAAGLAPFKALLDEIRERRASR